MLLVLEDLQWADPETLAVVEYLADNCAGERLVLVATCRDVPGTAMDLLERLARRGSPRLEALAALTGEQVGTWSRRVAVLRAHRSPSRFVTGQRGFRCWSRIF
ncbi:hypothetical protein [Pseudonocardia sp. T1-2H]|uniref:hypothetical protein n=1 Tax=Pseudonocardia sp. T1-2H TaxID=3128899 RepID=UPI003101AA5D